MRKLFVLVMTLCLMTAALYITAFATNEPDEGTVLRVSGQKSNSTEIVVIKDHKNFKDGWDDAMSQAEDAEDNGYDRIIVELYADWNTADIADPVYISSDVCVTLNMNGHTIDRAMTSDVDDGEVIHINGGSNVTINDGTITGGYSNGGAGGIHIDKKAKVTLNNVNVVRNRVKNDQGAGISVNSDAVLTVNGGSISHNLLEQSKFSMDNSAGAGIAASYSTVTLNGVTMYNNQCYGRHFSGVAVSASYSTLVMNGCRIDENGIEDEDEKFFAAYSIINGYFTNVTIQNTKFVYNSDSYGYSGSLVTNYSLISMHAADLVISNGSFIENNGASCLIDARTDATVTVSDTSFRNNTSAVYSGNSMGPKPATFTNCVFANNSAPKGFKTFDELFAMVTFTDCDMGNSTFANEEYVKIQQGTFYVDVPIIPHMGMNSTEMVPLEKVPEETAPEETIPEETVPEETTPEESTEGEISPRAGTMFGEGSITMVVALAALVISVASMIVTLTSNKKK